MAQKSILSFFKIPVKSSVETSPSNKVESPKKGPQKIKQLIESDDEEINDTKKRTSSKDDDITEKNGKQEEGEKQINSFESANGHVNVKSSPENIPKRKTARKQIRSKSVNKKDSSKPKAKKSSRKDEKNVNNNSDKGFGTTGEKHEPKTMNNSKEVVKSKSPVQNSSNIDLKQIQMDTNDKSSDDSEISQTKSAKSKKRKQKDKNQTNSDGPSKKRKVEKNLKVEVEDKKDVSAEEEDIETLVDHMELAEAANNSKPIHSFFAPMKKESSVDTKRNKDELKKEDSRSDDDNSPQKRPQKLKRVRQLVESDEDEEISDIKTDTNPKIDSDVIAKEDEPEKNNSQDKAVEHEVNEKKSSPKSNASKKTAPKKKETTTDTKSKKAELTKKNSMPSAVADTSFNPSKNNYHPIDDAMWKKNENVPYLALAKTLEYIENISSRLKIIEILANLFRSVIVLTPGDLLQTLYLCLNRLAPEYEGIELGVGETLLMKAVAQATGRTLEKIKAEVAVKGDLGLVAESSRGNQRVMFAPPKLTVVSAFNKFKEIAKMSGNSAMAKKTDKIQVLFVACRDCEAKYIIRSLSGKLRIGLAEQSVLAALARAVILTPPGQSYPPEVIDSSSGVSAEKFKKKLDSQTLELKTVYCECPNYDIMIPVLLKEGILGLSAHCHLNPGTPLKPMLAHPTKGIDEVLRRFDNNEFTCEFKYDGERAQIHMMEDGDIKVFSRNQENNTSKYPDVIARLKNALKEETKSFILDTEAVAWDREAKQILPFQVLSTRKKKDAVESEITVHVCIMAFDLLYLNGKSLVKTPLKERRDLLHSSFTEVEDEIKFVTYKDGNSADIMQQFLDESIKGNCEGLMVKSLVVDASYEIAKRSHNWLKLKKDYLEGVGDTIDVVVIGGYHGKGKRTGTYGGFLLACYDDENEEFQSICKIGTGFKDEELETHSEFFKQHVIKCAKSYYRYDTSLEPDAWFEAVQVWEIKCADLSISPIHKAAIGIVDPEKGISLRFPRFLKVRDDKKTEDATTSSQIAKMYESQEQVQNQTSKDVKMEEDYY